MHGPEDVARGFSPAIAGLKACATLVQLGRTPRPVVVQAEQLDDGLHVIATADAAAYPSRLRKDMMRAGLPLRNQLFAHFHRKREIGQPAAVQVSEFAPADAELDAAEAMRLDADAFPSGDLVFDERDKSVRCHVVHGHDDPSVRLNDADRKPTGSIIKSLS